MKIWICNCLGDLETRVREKHSISFWMTTMKTYCEPQTFKLISVFLVVTGTSQAGLCYCWIVPDGTNQTLEEIRDKKVSSGISPGGGQAGGIVVSLQRLEPYYGTQFFLIDLETGEVFAYAQQQWRRAGLEAEQQTPLMDLGRTPGQFEVPPLLPTMDEPDIYILQMPCKQTLGKTIWEHLSLPRFSTNKEVFAGVVM